MATPTEQRETSPSESIVRNAGITSAAVFMSRITGLVREMVMAALFGASQVSDAFQVAFRIPNLTRDLFAEGALSSAFVPIFTEYLSKKGKQEAAVLANLVATALIVIVGTLCALGILFSPQLVHWFAGGFEQVPGKFELAVRMTRIMFPFLLLVALAAQAMGVLNACNRFGVPAMASTFFNIGSLVFGLLIGKVLGPRIGVSDIEGMAYGVVAGGALQLLWQVPSLSSVGFNFHPRFSWHHEGLQRIFRMMGPAILGNAAVQINVLVNTSIATQINDPIAGPNGPVSWLGYAFRFMQLPLGIFGVAIGSATLPAISRSAAMNNMDEFRRTLSRSVGLVFLLTVPSAVGLAVLGESIVGGIYQLRSFGLYDTQQTAVALSCYAIGLAGYSATKVLNPAFYALGDSRTPMIVSFVSIVINYAMSRTMVNVVGLGHAGLALSTSTVAIFSALALMLVMRNRVNGIYGRDLRSTVFKVSIAAILMGASVWLSSHGIRMLLGVSKLARWGDLAVSIPLGLAIFYTICRLTRVAELEMALRAVAGPLQRRLPFLRAKIAS